MPLQICGQALFYLMRLLYHYHQFKFYLDCDDFVTKLLIFRIFQVNFPVVLEGLCVGKHEVGCMTQVEVSVGEIGLSSSEKVKTICIK